MERQVLNVLIASPPDIVVERKIVREVCSGLNDGTLLNHPGISFQIATWEDVFHSAESAQDIIKKIVDEYDVFVCIFHKRFNVHSDKRGSDTLEEFLLAYDLWKSLKKPHIMFYFKEVKVSSIEDLDDPQLHKVLEFKEKVKSEHASFYEEFAAPYEFCEKIYDHLEKWTGENIENISHSNT